jgi:hypothetical protein
MEPQTTGDGHPDLIALIKRAQSLELHRASATGDDGTLGYIVDDGQSTQVVLFNHVDFVAAVHYLVAEGCEVDMVLNGGLAAEASWLHITKAEHEYDLSLTVRLS